MVTAFLGFIDREVKAAAEGEDQTTQEFKVSYCYCTQYLYSVPVLDLTKD